MFSPVGCWTSGTWTPALQVFKQPSPGEEAAMALASFGAAAVDPLVNALQDANPSVRRNAAWAIGEIRSGLSVDRGHAIPLLFAALADDDPWVRRAAAFSLGEIREDSAAAALIGRLGDEAAGVREMAARALGEMKAPGALRPLAVAVNDQDKQVSRAARWALSEVLSQPLTNSN
jgi:HEAT repeat protein